MLGDGKQYLVTSRISKIMKQHQVPDLQDLIRRMQRTPLSGLKEEVIDAMTTNETLWFRDTHPFNILSNKLFPELMEGGFGNIRIWSAASSSGQEPYSISMCVEEFKLANRGMLKRQVEIIGTDLSKTMLEQCRKAEYDSLALGRGLSPQRKQQFFDQRDDKGVWAVKPAIKQRVRFQPLNLLDSYNMLGKFEIVFCRNVLIYFSSEVKTDILRRIHACLKPGGYLFLGASEGLNNLQDKYDMVQCSPGIVYRAK